MEHLVACGIGVVKLFVYIQKAIRSGEIQGQRPGKVEEDSFLLGFQ